MGTRTSAQVPLASAGTTTVMKSFQHIFRREKINAQIVEGDAFHRYDRLGMRDALKQAERDGVRHFSHFGPTANLLEELEQLFATYAEAGTGQFRRYVHDEIMSGTVAEAPSTQSLQSTQSAQTAQSTQSTQSAQTAADSTTG